MADVNLCKNNFLPPIRDTYVTRGMQATFCSNSQLNIRRWCHGSVHCSNLSVLCQKIDVKVIQGTTFPCACSLLLNCKLHFTSFFGSGRNGHVHQIHGYTSCAKAPISSSPGSPYRGLWLSSGLIPMYSGLMGNLIFHPLDQSVGRSCMHAVHTGVALLPLNYFFIPSKWRLFQRPSPPPSFL